jgi:hypothetical protein
MHLRLACTPWEFNVARLGRLEIRGIGINNKGMLKIGKGKYIKCT